MSLFYITSVVGGLCLNGSIPLFFELAVESSYPVAEGINTGAMTFSNNVYCLIFLSLPLIPNVGTSWMNWFLVASCVLCIPTMIIFKERYRRLEIDLVENNTKGLNDENSLNYPVAQQSKSENRFFSISKVLIIYNMKIDFNINLQDASRIVLGTKCYQCYMYLEVCYHIVFGRSQYIFISILKRS